MTKKKVIRAISSRPEEQRIARYMQEVRDIQTAGLNRRDLLRMGLTAGVGGLVATNGRAFLPNLAHADKGSGSDGSLRIISPPITNPWTNPLPIPQTCKPTPELMGGLTAAAAPDEQESCHIEDYYAVPDYCQGLIFKQARTKTDTYERWDELIDQTSPCPYFYNGSNSNLLYEICTKEIPWNFYSDAGGSPGNASVWAFHDMHSDAAGIIRINADYGAPILMRMYNMLNPDNKGICGISQQTTHLHNAHNPAAADGGPLRFYEHGSFWDYWYPNIRAGFASTHKDGTWFKGPDGELRQCPGDYRETLSTLWFHDHRMDFTAQNVYRGLASFYTLFSKDINLDTGIESPNPAERGLGLPAGDYDIPLLFTDKTFYDDGEMFFDLNNKGGMVGDMQTVNFKIKPYLEVKRRRYRFRLLNGGPSRFCQFRLLDKNGKPVPVLRVTTDGNLLPKPIWQTDIRLSVAERADIVIDFSKYPQNEVLFLHNVLEQTTAQGVSGKTLVPGERTKLLKFIVGEAVTDYSLPTDQLAQKPLLELPNRNKPIAARRTFDFGFRNGQWVVNDRLFDPSRISAYPTAGTAEIWTIKSGGGWSHPIHTHHCEGQVISRNGDPRQVPADEIARKDVFRIGDGAVGTSGGGELQYFVQFRDWHGDYPVHCHNVVHEDHAMMIRFKVVPATDPQAGQ